MVKIGQYLAKTWRDVWLHMFLLTHGVYVYMIYIRGALYQNDSTDLPIPTCKIRSWLHVQMFRKCFLLYST